MQKMLVYWGVVKMFNPTPESDIQPLKNCEEIATIFA